jgi:mannose-6-phosphate isomerase-like protein (cupin superfamily)
VKSFDWASNTERRSTLVDPGADRAEEMSVELIRLPAGDEVAIRPHPGRSESFFVLAGQGSLSGNGEQHALAQETFAWLADDRGYTIQNSGQEDLRLVLVSAPPRGREQQGAGGKTTVLRVADQPVELEESSGKQRIYLANHELVGSRRAHAMIVIYPGGSGVVTPTHYHPEAESLFIFIRGRGRAIVDASEELKPVEVGRGTYYGKREYHGLDNLGAEDFAFLEYHIPEQYTTVYREPR